MSDAQIVILCVSIQIIILSILWYIVSVARKKKKLEISFKETLDLVEVPVITFKIPGKDGMVKVNLIVDTGASECFIHTDMIKLFDENKMSYYQGDDNEMCSSTTVTSTDGNVYLELNYGNCVFDVPFVMVDLSNTIDYIKETCGVTISGLLGTTFLKVTKSIVDFEVFKIKIQKKNDY